MTSHIRNDAPITRGDMEIWGHCSICDRWFYCPVSDTGPDGDREPAWCCPVCGSEPAAIENRAAT